MIASIELFEALKTRFGETEAKTIVREIERIETKVDENVGKAFDARKDVLATKADIAQLKEEMHQLRIDLERGFRDNLKWTIATMFVFAGLILGGLKLLF